MYKGEEKTLVRKNLLHFQRLTQGVPCCWVVQTERENFRALRSH